MSDESQHSENEGVKLGVRLSMFEFNQNDPKRDSGMKLCRLGLARSFKPGAVFKGILLSAEAHKTLSPADAPQAAEKGFGAVNCSWNRLEEVEASRLRGTPRKLPFLVAANPTNYGKPFKLNTAEALVASLAICGFRHDAERVAAKYSWGAEFFKINGDLIDRYSKCPDEYSVRLAAAELTGQPPPSPPKAARTVTFAAAPIVHCFEKASPIPTEVVFELPEERPADQRRTLAWMVSVLGSEKLGLPKNASNNTLAKIKLKEYERIWTEFRKECLSAATADQRKSFPT